MCTELELVLCLDGEAKAAKAHRLFLPVVQASWGTWGKIWDKLKKFLFFFFSTVYFTARCHTHTHTKLSAETHIFTEEQAQKHTHRSQPPPVCVGGGKEGGGNNISLERDWCDLFSTSLFEDDLSEQPVLSRPGCRLCVWFCVCVWVRVSTADQGHLGKKLLYYFSDCNKSVCSPLSLSIVQANMDKLNQHTRDGLLVFHGMSPTQ